MTLGHVLLPVRMAACRPGDRGSLFVASDQTGGVGGERSWSRRRVAPADLLVLAIAGALAYQWGEADGHIHVNSF